MIEESERLKSSMEGNAAHLADKLVPYTLLGTVFVYLLTRNPARALSVLMVDFSCALKLAMPIAVLSAIREAGIHRITVKGGKFLERTAEADTIIFDKTGTLTKAHPAVVEIVSFCSEREEELLGMAACLEEHFPHSMAKAVVCAAQERGITHEEKHSRVEYIVAHGISSMVDGSKVIIGSYHFVFEDEGCIVPEGMQERFEGLPKEYTHLFLAVEGKVAADVGIAISDGAQIAREIADITINADNLSGLVTLKLISNGLMKRIRKNYFSIIGINSGLIFLGVSGAVRPTASALVHNASTLAISLNSMKDLLPSMLHNTKVYGDEISCES